MLYLFLEILKKIKNIEQPEGGEVGPKGKAEASGSWTEREDGSERKLVREGRRKRAEVGFEGRRKQEANLRGTAECGRSLTEGKTEANEVGLKGKAEASGS